MAVKMYYGICATTGSTAIKKVHINDIDLAERNFGFQEGDALSVYFAYTNTAEAPTLKIYIGDTEQERSISEDSGKAIKTLGDSTRGIVGAWDDGETVIFVYTNEANTNNYYWELVNSAPSTEDVYGVTKLFGNAEQTLAAFKNWLTGITPSDSDYNTALTPGLLKKFYDVLSTDSGSMINLSWEQRGEGENLTTLGILKVNNDGDNSVTIKYPLETFVKDLINAKLLSTRDLKNWGPDPNKDYKTEDGQFYITNILPINSDNNLPYYLYYKKNNTNRVFIMPETSYGNLHLRGANGITLNASNSDGSQADAGVGTVLCRPVFHAASDVKINGTTTTKGITCTGLTVNGSGIVTSSFETKGNLKGKVIYEDGIKLKSKYSGIISIQNFRVGPIKIAKNGTCGHKSLNIKKDGYSARCVVGYNLDYGDKNTNDGAECYVWEQYVNQTEQKLYYSFRNTKNAQVIVKCTFFILYTKIL